MTFSPEAINESICSPVTNKVIYPTQNCSRQLLAYNYL